MDGVVDGDAAALAGAGLVLGLGVVGSEHASLLRRPRLLLLDEITSQLDAVNEAALRETIAAAATITVLVVAHRLSTVTMADRIVVMDTGKVRAIGTHTELVITDPLYAELAATQLLTAEPSS